MIFKDLFRRKIRTLLTTLGIAIGVAAIVALGALSEGMAAAYGGLGGGSKADLLVAQRDAVDIAFSAVAEDVGARLAGMPGVAEVTSMVYTLAASGDIPYFIVFGYDPNGFAIDHFKIVAGEGLGGRSAQRGGRAMLLGRMAADDLEKRVGDTMRLYEATFRIVGIYETGTPIEDGSAVITIEDAQTISKHPRQVNAFLVKLRSDEDIESVRARIERRFDDLTVTLSSDFADSQQTLAYIDAFTWAVSFLAVLIGGIGVMNTLLMSVFERTREFGTLRAVGWRPGQVLRMVLSESLVLCGLGGIVGAGLGAALVWVVEQLPMMGSFLSSSFSVGLFVQGIAVALVLGLVGGAYPAWRASRLLPAEAMRYEGGAGSRRQEARGRRQETGFLHPASCILLIPVVRNLLRQPTRTTLTLLGIGAAIMAMVSLGGLSEGLSEEMTSMMSKSGIHLAGMEAAASMDLSAIDLMVVRRIADIPGVQDVEGFLTGYATVGDLPFFVVFGYHPLGRSIRDFEIVEGAPLTANRQIIIGRVAAENLDKQVGQTLRVFDSSFRIVGIYETGVPFEDGGGVMSLRDAQKLFGQPRKVSFLGVRLTDPLQAESVERTIESRFPEVSISKASEFTEDVGDFKMMEGGIWGIAFLALLVGGAGMTNTMVMSVLERTREIGVLRALGWRKGQVVRMILRESVVLSVLGGWAGFMAGIGVIALLNLVPAMAGFVKASFSPELFGQAFITSLVLGGVGGVYPAWRASHLRPVEALRYE
ncbi:MAG: ABC transporter permease [Anaerolineae bacterium]|nr:ABC transporter permease [Anaerolineae bacterium]